MANYRTNDLKQLGNVMAKKIQEDLAKLSQVGDFTIAYGVPKGQTEDGQQIEEIAIANNYGVLSQNIPARPFLSTVKTNYSQRIHKDIKGSLNKSKSLAISNEQVSKQDVMQLLEVNLALPLENYTRDNLLTGDWVENKQATIKRKGSSKPLVDKGQLSQSIKGIVVEK